MFLHLTVCPHGERRCYDVTSYYGQYHPLPPDTSPRQHHPLTEPPPGQHHPQTAPPPGQHHPWTAPPDSPLYSTTPLGQHHPPREQAGGTHPSGMLSCFPYLYRLQRSCSKVMFLYLCVILFTGGLCQGDLSLDRDSPPGQRTLRQRPPGQRPPGQRPLLDRDSPG